ncbi:MAG TPA: nucleoside hydrolase [Planctomycetota bacterium]|nr:nucleoside hydrolase [Planctomycetota bacterium]
MVPQKIIIDTDIGDDIDDAIAVSFAVRRPELEVVGITTCHGPTDRRCRMLAKQLSLLGVEDIPFAPGPHLPLAPTGGGKWAEDAPLEYDFVGDDEPVRPPASDDAVEFLYELICRHAGEVILVTIGPLTNIGVLFREHPDAADKLPLIAMMAGNYPQRRREYNMWRDPEASKVVLATKTPKFLGTYDVTRRVVMGDAEIQALRASRDPACQGLLRQIELWWPHKGGKTGPVVYDMSPIVWCFDRSFFTTHEYRIDVLLEGPERGWNVESDSATSIDVSVDVREDDMLEMLMKTLLGEE